MDETKTKTFTPCLKHAVSNLEHKSSDISSDVSLCSNCSKTMLSYIFLIQDVLDNLAKSIYGRRDSQCCVQCLRQATQTDELPKQEGPPNESEKTGHGASNEEVPKQEVSRELSNKKEETVPNGVASKAKKPSSRRNSRRLSREIKNIDKTPPMYISNVNQDWKINFLYDVAADFMPILPTVKSDRFMKGITIQDTSSKAGDEYSREKSSCVNEEVKNGDFPNSNAVELFKAAALRIENESVSSSVESTETFSCLSDESCEDNTTIDTNYSIENGACVKENCLEPENPNEENASLPSSEENSRHDVPQETEKTSVIFSSASCKPYEPLPQAFVTVCRNNSEAIGCLVLGSSLLLCRSSKILCVLVYEGISEKLRELLASIFHVVQSVSSLDTVSNGSNSRNFGKPLEISNVWLLTQFSKCVFLNSDTMVLRNCDELFSFSELSAVPDNGWPDCFNSGVFVFVPSLTTFNEMNDMYEKQGCSEGGDQIFLNMYFNTWSEGLSKKLPFIYNLNLIGASTYTYAAAFHRFGQNVKIVQFSGTQKPWDIEFCSETNQITDSSSIPKTSMRFVNEWINIFRVSVTRLLPMDIYSLTFSQKSISAQAIMSSLYELQIFHYNGFGGTFQNDRQENSSPNNNCTETPSHCSKKISVIQHDIKPVEKNARNFANICDTGDKFEENTEASIKQLNYVSPPKENLFPVSLLMHSLPVTCGNYDGMRMWEQGKMDYEGIDNSEGIIKRLQLMIQ